MTTIAILIIASGIVSLLSLLFLHIVSPEFKPSWRMVSEYALGKHKWLLSSFFIFWSISNLLTAYFYFNIDSTKWVLVGSILVFISGIGALMGGLFDINHKLHGLSFALGVPTFPIGALLIAYHLSNPFIHQKGILISAHSVWLSLVIMAVSMGLFFSGLKKAGIPFGPNRAPFTEIPSSVIAINGYANRLLIIAYIAFNLIAAFIYISHG